MAYRPLVVGDNVKVKPLLPMIFLVVFIDSDTMNKMMLTKKMNASILIGIMMIL